MLLNTGKKEYMIIREVLRGEANDVYVCRDKKEPAAPYKTVLIVKNRHIAKELMGTLGDTCEEYFMRNEDAGFVFPYDGERPLYRFYQGTVLSGGSSETRIWLELVVRCMTSKMPHPLLRLILEQDQVHVGADGAVWFGYFLDLSEYDASVGEKENAQLCAEHIAELIELDAGKKEMANKSYMKKLLAKKMERGRYDEFIRLYGDVKLMLKEDGNQKKKERLLAYVAARRDLIYRMLSAVGIALACIVIITLAGNLVFGDFTLWRLFSGPLDKIGTETLVR